MLPHRFTQSAPILDYAWYPSATVRDPASFCFVASVRECPVKLLDASDGRVQFSNFVSAIHGILTVLAYHSSGPHIASWITVNGRLRLTAWPSILAQTGMRFPKVCVRMYMTVPLWRQALLRL